MSMPPGPADMAHPKRVARRTKERAEAHVATTEGMARKRGGSAAKTRARGVEAEPVVTAAAENGKLATKAKAEATSAAATPADTARNAAVVSDTLTDSTHLSTNMPKDFPAETTFATTPRPAATGDKTNAAGAGAGGAAGGAGAQPVAPVVSPRSLLKEAEEKLSLLRDNREIFEWILEKQSSLRTEFVGFLKKDLREIDYVVSDINTQGDRGDFAANALELIKNTYIKHWERSFELISPENVLQRTDEKS